MRAAVVWLLLAPAAALAQRSVVVVPAKPPADAVKAGRGASETQTERTSDSSSDPGSEQQEIPEGMLQLWRLATPHLRGPPSGASFVELAETTTDAKVLAVALHAIALLHTSRTSTAQYRFEGKDYPALPANDRVFAVGLRHLAHPDKFVRGGAARVVGLGIARTPPDDSLVSAIGERFSAEPDLSVRAQLLDVLWSCHCATRAMADAAIWFAEQNDQKSRLQGLTVMRKVGVKGRTFDAELRGSMRRAAEDCLDHPAADVRAAAEAAVKQTAHGAE